MKTDVVLVTYANRPVITLDISILLWLARLNDVESDIQPLSLAKRECPAFFHHTGWFICPGNDPFYRRRDGFILKLGGEIWVSPRV